MVTLEYQTLVLAVVLASQVDRLPEGPDLQLAIQWEDYITGVRGRQRPTI